jgi:hypothetical protein
MTAQAKDKSAHPFCDNPKCNFHHVMVSAGCTGLESGDIKVERQFFSKVNTMGFIRLCGTCSEVVPMFVRCQEETIIDGEEASRVWRPDSKIIVA